MRVLTACTTAATLALVLGFGGQRASAQGFYGEDERYVRQAGDNTVVRLPGQFTIQAKNPNDVVYFYEPGGGQIVEFWELLFWPQLQEYYVTSYGEYVVRLSYNRKPRFQAIVVQHQWRWLDVDLVQ